MDEKDSGFANDAIKNLVIKTESSSKDSDGQNRSNSTTTTVIGIYALVSLFTENHRRATRHFSEATSSIIRLEKSVSNLLVKAKPIRRIVEKVSRNVVRVERGVDGFLGNVRDAREWWAGVMKTLRRLKRDAGEVGKIVEMDVTERNEKEEVETPRRNIQSKVDKIRPPSKTGIVAAPPLVLTALEQPKQPQVPVSVDTAQHFTDWNESCDKAKGFHHLSDDEIVSGKVVFCQCLMCKSENYHALRRYVTEIANANPGQSRAWKSGDGERYGKFRCQAKGTRDVELGKEDLGLTETDLDIKALDPQPLICFKQSQGEIDVIETDTHVKTPKREALILPTDGCQVEIFGNMEMERKRSVAAETEIPAKSLTTSPELQTNLEKEECVTTKTELPVKTVKPPKIQEFTPLVDNSQVPVGRDFHNVETEEESPVDVKANVRVTNSARVQPITDGGFQIEANRDVDETNETHVAPNINIHVKTLELTPSTAAMSNKPAKTNLTIVSSSTPPPVDPPTRNASYSATSPPDPQSNDTRPTETLFSSSILLLGTVFSLLNRVIEEVVSFFCCGSRQS
ncbi:hypothetical protein HDU67_006526 [Dinochytrium kinnereticum]|nr:hypothetical protein HDU67_006526 [Dinochytrium kinnereticum]